MILKLIFENVLLNTVYTLKYMENFPRHHPVFSRRAFSATLRLTTNPMWTILRS